MKVIDLIAELSALPENYPVYFASDEEGNDYYSQVDVEADGEGNVVIYPSGMRLDLYG